MKWHPPYFFLHFFARIKNFFRKFIIVRKKASIFRAKTNEDGAPILRNTKTSLRLSLIEARSMAFNPKMDEMKTKIDIPRKVPSMPPTSVHSCANATPGKIARSASP